MSGGQMIDHDIIILQLLQHIKRLCRSLRQALIDHRRVDLCLIARFQQRILQCTGIVSNRIPKCQNRQNLNYPHALFSTLFF